MRSFTLRPLPGPPRSAINPPPGHAIILLAARSPAVCPRPPITSKDRKPRREGRGAKYSTPSRQVEQARAGQASQFPLSPRQTQVIDPWQRIVAPLTLTKL